MFDRIRQRLNWPSRRPYHLMQIETSLHCNLECVMCPWVDIHSDTKLLSRETFSKILPYLPFADEVDLTGGGEPLVNPLLPEMVLAAKQAGCEVGFSTNGTLLKHSLSKTLIQMGLDWISFSFDAANPDTYHQIRQGSSFDTVVRNIGMMGELKEQLGSKTPRVMMVFVMMTGTNENFQELPDYLDLAYSLGASQVIAKNLDVIVKDGDYERGLFSHSGRPREDVIAIRQQAQKHAEEIGIGLRLYDLQPHQQVICEQRPVKNLYINWEGNVSPCITLSYASSRVFYGERVSVPCQIYGNVHQDSLEDIWNKPEYVAFREVYKKRLRQEQESLMQTMLGGEEGISLTPAPKGCQTCYYLYGI